MKTISFLCLALLAANVANAEVFRSRVRGGHDSHRSQATVRSGHHHVDHAPYRHYDRHYHGRLGFGYYGSPYRYSVFPRYSYVPSYGYYSGYGYGYPYYDSGYGYYGSSSAATSGLVLGALAGGIIGHNSGDLHHSAWRGSAWGAGLGWLLGSVVDANRSRAVVTQPASVIQPSYPTQPQVSYGVPTHAAASTQPQQPVTIINNYYNSSTPMSGVNGMFGR